MQGQLDSHLTPNGIKQAEVLAFALKDKALDVIYTSKLSRSIDTAKIVNKYHNVKLVKSNLLNELSQGVYEGFKGEKMYRAHPKRDIELDFCPKGAESIRDFEKRLLKFVSKLPKKGSVLIVAHKGVNMILLNHFLGKPLIDWVKVKQDHTCINLISFSNGGFKVEKTNDISHLKKNNVKKIKEVKGVY
jgi:broad specificity phosphatase PhoE